MSGWQLCVNIVTSLSPPPWWIVQYALKQENGNRSVTYETDETYETYETCETYETPNSGLYKPLGGEYTASES